MRGNKRSHIERFGSRKGKYQRIARNDPVLRHTSLTEVICAAYWNDTRRSFAKELNITPERSVQVLQQLDIEDVLETDLHSTLGSKPDSKLSSKPASKPSGNPDSSVDYPSMIDSIRQRGSDR